MSNPEQDPQQKRRQNLREKYQAALEMVWRRPDNCPICESTFWNIGDLIDVPLRIHDMAPGFSFDPKPREAYVYVPVTCVYCGYSIFFHSGVLDARLTEEVKAVPPLAAPGDRR
jgi:hypothetical protein